MSAPRGAPLPQEVLLNAPMRARPDWAELRAHAGAAAGLLKALSNEHRLLILCALAEGTLSVGELNARVPLAQSALSQHLARLRAGGLVTTRRAGQNVYYALADGPAARVIALLYAEFCAPSARRRRR